MLMGLKQISIIPVNGTVLDMPKEVKQASIYYNL